MAATAASASPTSAGIHNTNNKPLPKPPEPSAPAATDVVSRHTYPDSAEVVSIPSYSRWFSWENIHQCELRFLPEFFDGRTPSKNSKVYKYYRNAIIHRFRDNPSKKITFTEVRKIVIGDVGSIRRVFDFLETWGLINYTPPPHSASAASKAAAIQLDKESTHPKSTPPTSDVTSSAASDGANTSQLQPKKKLCGDCKCVCSFSCFTSDKLDLTLCARCYVNQSSAINTSDFRRVEITEVVKNDWTDKETLLLLEAVMHYGDDWKKVADRVTGKNDKECVARFIKLPFGDQFVGSPESSEVEHEFGPKDSSFPNKKMRLTPLADASNPIMAQAAFLSALVGAEVAEVSANAAVAALYEYGAANNKENPKSVPGGSRKEDSDAAADVDPANSIDQALAEAESELEKEEEDLEKAVSNIAVQAKEIHDKIVHFEELDIELEKEFQQMQQLKDALFVDQLTLMFHQKGAADKTGVDSVMENVKVDFKVE
ncbi:OLC1v1018448C1 [Oldenlandia corymbosa var. corymbosa]|uniref:OLC1v1018448C1 n=1 Tax=Oldenlandia corymbosa var. corymbosa TaxID=529605 RepID=A0AAV1EBM0_OLDCO|nr:OLC1v1018448C1 [Oldenlandia corymbosa var. corymbosa]